MATIRLELPADLPTADIDTLRTALSPYGDVYKEPAVTFDAKSVMLGISFVSEVLQGADVLVNWLKRTPRANKAVIRFSDGRTIRLEDTNPEAFRKVLRAALK